MKGIDLGAFVVFCLLFTGCATTTHIVPETAASLAGMEASPPEWKGGVLEKTSYKELLGKASSYLGQGDFELARLHFLMALKKNPQSAPAYTGLGQTFIHEGRFNQARAAFRNALDKDEKYVPALIAAGKLWRAENKYGKAEGYLRKALALQPENPAILTELAITLDAKGEETNAEPLFRKVVKSKPEDASARNNLGFNYLLQKHYPEAANELRRALNLAPTNRRIRNNLAAAYALGGNEEQAFSLLVQTVGEAGAYNNIGYIYMTRGELKKAKKAFQNALQAKPSFYARARSNLEHLRRLQNQSMLDGTESPKTEWNQENKPQEKGDLES